jgi:hypothetical protein
VEASGIQPTHAPEGIVHKAVFKVIFFLILSFSMGCGGHSHEELEGVSVWQKIVNGSVAEVGASIAMSTVEHEKDTDLGVHMNFPYQTQQQTFLNHIGFGYHPNGHGPPGVNDVPHYDMHFYAETQEEREAIECGGQPQPGSNQVPAGVEKPAMGGEPFGSCVAGMGAHSSLPYDKLNAEMIYGFNNGKLSFLEPMIHEDNLLGKKELEFEILPPPKWGAEINYPHKARLFHNPEKDTYDVVLTDFRIID